MRIENRDDEFGLDVKRFYIPATVHDKCPSCGADVERDLMDEYLSYPSANDAFDLEMGHSDCPNPTTSYGDTTWKARVVLRVTLEAA